MFDWAVIATLISTALKKKKKKKKKTETCVTLKYTMLKFQLQFASLYVQRYKS